MLRSGTWSLPGPAEHAAHRARRGIEYAATILGTLVGIARLSRNWIVSKLATVYVEAVRNVPLALFVVAGLLVVVLGVFPTIQDAWQIGGLAIISNRGVAVPWFIGAGLGLLVLGAIGVFAVWLVAKWRASVSDRTGALPRSGLWGGGAFLVVVVIGWTALGYEWTCRNSTVARPLAASASTRRSSLCSSRS